MWILKDVCVIHELQCDTVSRLFYLLHIVAPYFCLCLFISCIHVYLFIYVLQVMSGIIFFIFQLRHKQHQTGLYHHLAFRFDKVVRKKDTPYINIACTICAPIGVL